jgi:hypothetical protein
MGIEQFMTDDNRAAVLRRIIPALASEIYRLCFVSGIDADEFDYTTYVAPVEQYALTYHKALAEKCASLKAAVKKLSEIENV